MKSLVRRVAGASFHGLIIGVALLARGAEDPARPTPPLPPLPPSPVALFRQLLGLAPQDRAAALAARSDRQRAAIESRVAEYESLPTAVREERLRATDLYWHLQQLLRRDPAEHATLVASAPPDLQSLLNERLALWNQLPPEKQAALLEHERTLRHLARIRTNPPPPLPAVAQDSSPGPAPTVSLRLQSELRQFEDLAPERWQTIHQHWRRFFETPAALRDRALKAMTDADRLQLHRVLDRFDQLPPDQRSACLDAFARIAALPTNERADFFRRAQRWETLPAADRQAWRRIVAELPLFPLLGGNSNPSPPPPVPPLPPPLPNARPPTSASVLNPH